MLLKAKIICLGGGANKAGIALMNEIPELASSIMLVNTTLKDIPMEYREHAIELQGDYKGCAKERSVARDIMLSNLKSGYFDYPADDADAMTIIVTSAEGGTGSGATPILAKYISSVYKSHIHIFVFTGFNSDVRGLKNTVDLFKELDSDYTVQSISNKKFLDDAHGNTLKAEGLANKEFINSIKILLGGTITESTQNIDESDLLKLVNTPGFMVIEDVNLGKVKNVDSFNTKLIEAIDDSKYLNVEPTCKRRGTILNISEKESDYVDYENSVLTERFGVPYESFSHIQHIHDHNYLQFIISGLKMPIEDIENAYEEFLKASEEVDKSKDDFFDKQFTTDSPEFDTLRNKESATNIKSAKDDFFNELSGDVLKTTNGKFTKVVELDKEDF